MDPNTDDKRPSKVEMNSTPEQPPLIEIRRSQNNPDSQAGWHTNGPAPAWFRVRGGPWRRIRGVGYQSDHKLAHDLVVLLDVAPAPGDEGE